MLNLICDSNKCNLVSFTQKLSRRIQKAIIISSFNLNNEISALKSDFHLYRKNMR